jgi:hypothetical protein
MTFDVHGGVKNPEYLDAVFLPKKVSDPVMTVICFCRPQAILHAAARRHNFLRRKGPVLAAFSSPRRADGS